MIENPRVLAAIRLSAMRDDSTSSERQSDSISHFFAAPHINGRIVGFAEDLDVSGGLHPMRRPSLGPWLTERAGEFDVIAVWKLDRLTRRSGHFAEIYAWCEENNKTIVSVTEGIDMSTPMGKMFAAIIIAFAEGELDTIKARIDAGVQTRKERGAWIAGAPPFGYKTAPRADGGKILVQDAEQAELVRWMKEKITEDWSIGRICRELNANGVLTSRDQARKQAKRKTTGIAWAPPAVFSILTNPSIAGYFTYKGEIVEDEEGNSRTITDDPILTPLEWTRLVARISSKEKGERDAPSRSMSAGVGTCGGCGAGLCSSKSTGRKGQVYFYYNCSKAKIGTCPVKTNIARDVLDGIINEGVMRALGSFPVFEKSSLNSSSLRTELDAATKRLHKLEDAYLCGEYDGEGQEASYQRMHKALSAKVSRWTEEIGVIDETPKYFATGRTWGEAWAEKDETQKRAFLKRHEVCAVVFRNAVDWADESVVITFGNLKEIAQENGLSVEGLDSHRFDYQVPIMSNGEPASIEELQQMVIERTAMAKAPATEEERQIVEHRKQLANERAKARRLNAVPA